MNLLFFATVAAAILKSFFVLNLNFVACGETNDF